MKRVSFRWKAEFINDDWYQDNPADQWLNLQEKLALLENYILGIEDLDSEVEVYIEFMCD